MGFENETHAQRNDAMTLPVLRLGTRASQLARWQADWVANALRQLGTCEVELVPISTPGDQRQDQSIASIGTQGVFTKALQDALLDGSIDLAVHSLKDLPTEPVPKLQLAAVPARGPQGDVLVARRGVSSIQELPVAAMVGTGSLRRVAQLLHIRPDLRMRPIRGNVDTRLRKVQAAEYDALILADAGLTRLGLEEHISQRIPYEIMLPAVGQGALGIETRSEDPQTIDLLAPLNDPQTMAAVVAERSLLATLRGGCLAPVGAWGRVEEETLHLSACVVSVDGRTRFFVEEQDSLDQARLLGKNVAKDLLARGADKLIQAARE